MVYEEVVIISMVVFLVVWISLIALIAAALEVRKTKKYRRELGDLYVAAKIRKIADSESIDLDKEKLSFYEWNKKRNLSEKIQNYDDVVEEEMKEKVADSLIDKPKE